MGAIASQITSLMIVHSIVHSNADQRKHQSSSSMAFVRWIHRGPVNSPHKWPVTRKMFPFDDVIMRITGTCEGNPPVPGGQWWIQRNIEVPHHWPFVRGNHRSLMDSPHKGAVMRKAFPCHDGIVSYEIPPDTGGWINMKMPSYQYRKSHCGDKTILRPSYLHNGFPILIIRHLYIESGPKWFQITYFEQVTSEWPMRLWDFNQCLFCNSFWQQDSKTHLGIIEILLTTGRS